MLNITFCVTLSFMKKVEHFLEKLMFASRWIMAPVYLGLIVCLVFLLYVFIHEIIVFIPMATSVGEIGLILFILNLIDLSLAGNLLLMVIFSGYENFISKIVMKVEGLGESEVPTPTIGKFIMEGLSYLDKVAYVRFASVYRNFKEAKDFEQFVGNLDDDKS